MINATAIHKCDQDLMDPTEFRWTSGLADKHFSLNYEERSWYFSEKAIKAWKNKDLKTETRIFGMLWSRK